MMVDEPSNDSESPIADSPPRRKSSWKSLFLTFLATTAGLVLLAALLLPAVRSARPAARRAQCSNNLKQIMLALHDYESTYKVFPPAYTVDAAGRPLHSWRTLILPYLHQKSLYEEINLSKPWNDPVNARASATIPPDFRCSEAAGPKSMTTYLAIVGPESFLAADHPRRVEEITDGAASTLAVIEVDDDAAVPWMAPLDADPAMATGLKTKEKLPHAPGVNGAFADGSARFLRADISTAEWQAMTSIAGNDEAFNPR